MAKTRWLDRRARAERYNVCVRTIKNWEKSGRLPPPEYPLGPDGPPMTREDVLDAHDRANVARAAKAVA